MMGSSWNNQFVLEFERRKKQFLQSVPETGAADLGKVIPAVTRWYHLMGHSAPVFLHVASPLQAQCIINVLAEWHYQELMRRSLNIGSDHFNHSFRAFIHETVGPYIQFDKVQGVLQDVLHKNLNTMLYSQAAAGLTPNLTMILPPPAQTALLNLKVILAESMAYGGHHPYADMPVARGMIPFHQWVGFARDELIAIAQDESGLPLNSWGSMFFNGMADTAERELQGLTGMRYIAPAWMSCQEIQLIARLRALEGLIHVHDSAEKWTPSRLALYQVFLDLAHSSGWVYALPGLSIICDRPAGIHRDRRERLHSETGAAIRYADDFGIYCIHGIRVPPQVITQPETITAKLIQSQINTEVRRVLIDKMGREKFLREADADKVDEHERFGTLWRTTRGEFWLEVVNSTPEPDGSYKHYILAIDPTAYRWAAGKYAQAAAASTWRHVDKSLVFEDWGTYQPQHES